MKLTRASSYALHAVVYLATQKQRDKPIASKIIARERDIPERFLLKVLKLLVDTEVLLSVKGPTGGYRLARPPHEITMLEIIEAVEGPICDLEPIAADDDDNPLNRRLDQICLQSAEQFRKQLGTIKISELVCIR